METLQRLTELKQTQQVPVLAVHLFQLHTNPYKHVFKYPVRLYYKERIGIFELLWQDLILNHLYKKTSTKIAWSTWREILKANLSSQTRWYFDGMLEPFKRSLVDDYRPIKRPKPNHNFFKIPPLDKILNTIPPNTKDLVPYTLSGQWYDFLLDFLLFVSNQPLASEDHTQIMKTITSTQYVLIKKMHDEIVQANRNVTGEINRLKTKYDMIPLDATHYFRSTRRLYANFDVKEAILRYSYHQNQTPRINLFQNWSFDTSEAAKSIRLLEELDMDDHFVLFAKKIVSENFDISSEIQTIKDEAEKLLVQLQSVRNMNDNSFGQIIFIQNLIEQKEKELRQYMRRLYDPSSDQLQNYELKYTEWQTKNIKNQLYQIKFNETRAIQDEVDAGPARPDEQKDDDVKEDADSLQRSEQEDSDDEFSDAREYGGSVQPSAQGNGGDEQNDPDPTERPEAGLRPPVDLGPGPSNAANRSSWRSFTQFLNRSSQPTQAATQGGIQSGLRNVVQRFRRDTGKLYHLKNIDQNPSHPLERIYVDRSLKIDTGEEALSYYIQHRAEFYHENPYHQYEAKIPEYVRRVVNVVQLYLNQIIASINDAFNTIEKDRDVIYKNLINKEIRTQQYLTYDLNGLDQDLELSVARYLTEKLPEQVDSTHAKYITRKIMEHCEKEIKQKLT